VKQNTVYPLLEKVEQNITLKVKITFFIFAPLFLKVDSKSGFL
jgi:hypothetical protein